MHYDVALRIHYDFAGAAERARTLAALQQTARERLATVLTPAQLKRYEDVMGRWIPRLTAPQPTPGN